MIEGSCRPVRRLVARGSVCSVEQCSCGVLHVNVGAFSVRLQKEVVGSVWETLGEALAQLAHDDRSAPALGFASILPPERPS